MGRRVYLSPPPDRSREPSGPRPLVDPRARGRAPDGSIDLSADVWLACHTQQEIAEAESLSEEGVRKVISQQTADLPKMGKAAAEHATDFEAPVTPTRARAITTGVRETNSSLDPITGACGATLLFYLWSSSAN